MSWVGFLPLLRPWVRMKCLQRHFIAKQLNTPLEPLSKLFQVSVLNGHHLACITNTGAQEILEYIQVYISDAPNTLLVFGHSWLFSENLTSDLQSKVTEIKTCPRFLVDIPMVSIWNPRWMLSRIIAFVRFSENLNTWVSVKYLSYFPMSYTSSFYLKSHLQTYFIVHHFKTNTVFLLTCFNHLQKQ